MSKVTAATYVRHPDTGLLYASDHLYHDPAEFIRQCGITKEWRYVAPQGEEYKELEARGDMPKHYGEFVRYHR